MWYDFSGEFTGLMHDKFTFCLNTELPIPFDPDIVGWLSTTENLIDLYKWFTEDDIKELQKFGYRICVYEAVDYKPHDSHWVIKQKTSKLKGYIALKD
jgi:hypothetical protein